MSPSVEHEQAARFVEQMRAIGATRVKVGGIEVVFDEVRGVIPEATPVIDEKEAKRITADLLYGSSS